MAIPDYFSNFGNACLFIGSVIKMSKLTSSSFFIFLLILILIGVVTAASREGYRRYKVDKEIAELKDQINSLEEENSSLYSLLGHFQSEEFLEKEARLKLNLIKQGEKLVIIDSDKKISSQQSNNQGEQKEQISNFKRWWSYFFNH